MRLGGGLMKPYRLLIIYASRHGQAEKIAKRISETVAADGVISDAVPIERANEFPLELYDFLIVAGSIHFGRHARALEKFIERKLPGISGMKAALVSVSGAASTAAGKEEAENYVYQLVRRTGWAPEIILTIGGGEPYTKYGFFTRMGMRSIAKKHGRIVDVHRDYEFTDWDAVDSFAHDFIRYVSAQRKSA
jgi:menaquinone-dependent protoporphyrinogen oxidase